jgi:lysophospholipase L1-like esterase
MQLPVSSRLRVKFWRVPSEPRRRKSNPTGSGRRIAFILLSAAIIFLAIETVLQIRSQIRFGQSIFGFIANKSKYVINERTGLKLLRPNSVFAGDKVMTRTNSLGLRSPEILPTRTADSLRIAIVGASTVMGVAAATNDDTFSALLESRLRKAFPGSTIEVINAGIAAYTLKEERLLLERLILPLRPDLVVAYTGINDFREYCNGATWAGKIGAAPQREGLPVISMPGWVISVQAILKNTTFLRTAPSRAGDKRDPYSVDLKPYRARLEALARIVLDANTSLVIATNARAYRPEQPFDEQQRLSFFARIFFTPCFDVAGLNTLHDLHNAQIRDVGERMGIPILPLSERIPGGERYFADSIHFTKEGERLVADEIFGFLMKKKLINF